MLFTNDSDKTWEAFGKKDPYFGVLTHGDFRLDKLDQEGRRTFFATGESYVDFVLGTVREQLDSSFHFGQGLDFGCGVGRLAIPLARASKSIIAVDVSESMLAEATKNIREHGISNVSFRKSDDRLSLVSGPLDFVHSLIVFQHIPCVRGETILKRLIELLRDGGVGILHFTYSWSSETPLGRQILTEAYKSVPLLYAARNVLKGMPVGERMMQMNRYDLNRLVRILHESGCHRLFVRFTETEYFGHPFYGAILFFQKVRLDVRAHA